MAFKSLLLEVVSARLWRRERPIGRALVCCLLLAMMLIGSYAQAEEIVPQGVPQPLFVASFTEPVTISASAGAFCPPLPATWQAEPATGTLVCLLQYPDGSPFLRPDKYAPGAMRDYNIRYRLYSTGGSGSICGSALVDADACYRFEVASFPVDVTQVTVTFWCSGYRRSRPAVVKLLSDRTASPSRIILRLLHEEPIVWTFRDPEGRPIASAALGLYEQGAGLCREILSDASGTIILPGEVGESYMPVRVVCKAPGFVEHRSKLKPDQILQNQEFILKPAAPADARKKYQRPPVELPIPVVAMREDAVVEFTLLDLYSGLPIASKSVTVTNLSAIYNNCQSPHASTRLVSDTTGRVTVNGLLPWWNFFALVVEGYGSKAFRGHGHSFRQPVFVWPGQNLVRQTVRLRPGRKIRIQINDSEKKPKAGYEARIGRIPNDHSYRWVIYSAEADADGWVELDDIAYRGLSLPFPDASGNRYINVASISEDGIVKVYEPIASEVWGWLELDLTHEDGRPFCEGGINYSLSGPDTHSTTANMNLEGRMRMRLLAGSYTIRLYGEYHSDLVKFDIEPGETTDRRMKMVLTRPYVIRLRVIDHAGQPVAGLRVRQTAPTWEDIEGETSASGTIDLPVSTTHSVASCTVRYFLYRPETAERQQISYPWQTFNIPAVDGSVEGPDRCETVTIRHGGEVSFQMPCEFTGQWFSAALFPQNSELIPGHRVVNFRANTPGYQVAIDDLAPGDYWLVVANDQKLAEHLARKGSIWPPLYGKDTIAGYSSRFAAAGIASVTVFSGQMTSVGHVMPEALATVCGILPTRSNMSASEDGIEWLDFERDNEINLYQIIKGGLRAVPTGKSAGRLPVFNLPVYVGGICYAQLPAGEYELYDVLPTASEPLSLGKFMLKPGETLHLSECPVR